MLKKFLIIINIFFFFTSNLYANSLEKDFLIKFDGLCVQNIDKIELVNSFAKAENWKTLPPEQ